MLPARPFPLRAARRLPFLLTKPAARRTLSFFGMRRWPLAWAPDKPGALRIRFQKPPRARSRAKFVALALLPLLVMQMFARVEVVNAEDDEALMKQKRVVKDDLAGGEDEEEDSGLFVPIWWPYPAEQEYYKGTDPEWLAFTKFSRDKEKKSEVFSECAPRRGVG
jgi:hypothetical protein